MRLKKQIAEHLAFLYGAERVPTLMRQLEIILREFQQQVEPRARQSWEPSLSMAAKKGPPVSALGLTEKDVILITYGDQIKEPGQRPLQTLAEILETHLHDVVSGLHILPFFPYSSDDGFSVIDYRAVNPDLGNWVDIERLGQTHRLMFDLVINHISAQSDWFQRFRQGDPAFSEYFLVVEKGTDLSQVVRPRALPLLTPVQTAHGERMVWTTFSADQIDLNYANPDVLLRMIEILLFYVAKGADIIRLDAIAYLWKKVGTSCIHLEETHRVAKLFRSVLDLAAPHVILITETNVPHEENISYFGDGTDEAQMVYQFPLPPLVLHTFLTGEATHLSTWAAGLKAPSTRTTFFNFLASHDGIGVRPAEGILNRAERQQLAEKTLAHGGYVSYKTDADGSQSIYELNISFFDALSNPAASESIGSQIRRFIASQAILLSLAGVPGIYIHSLLGSRSYHTGVEETGHYRAINREKLSRHHLEQELSNPDSLRHQVFQSYQLLLRARTTHSAFHPKSPQQIIPVHPALFVVLRRDLLEDEAVLCVHNVSGSKQRFQADLTALVFPHTGQLRDLVTGSTFLLDRSGMISLELSPYQVLWLAGEHP